MTDREAHIEFKKLLLRIWRECNNDNVAGTAAELSYYFLLALFPLLIFLTSLIGFLPDAPSGLIDYVARVAPPDALKLVRETLTDVVKNRSGGLLSFALIGTVWASSSGVASLMEALNIAYEAKETRPFWKRRLIAIGLTMIFTLLVIGGSGLIIIGHRLGDWLEHSLGLGAALNVASTVLGYLTGLGLLLAGVGVLYTFGPDLKTANRRVLPGALFAAVGIVAGSLLFSFYLRAMPALSATYGSLGAVVTLMLWLYLIGLLLLVGGEINSEVDRV